MFYDRKIKYMDVYENDEKVQNAGFVRLEAKEGRVKIQLQISKLRFVDTYECPILLLSSGKEAVIGTLSLEKGSGTAEFVGLSVDNLLEGISYEALREVQVRLSAGRVLRGIVRAEEPKVQQIEEMAEQTRLMAAEQEVVKGNEDMPESQMLQEDEDMSERRVLQDKALQANDLARANLEIRKCVGVQKDEKKRELESGREREGMQNAIKPDKWQQLWSIYPHIRPFDDKREYIMFKPQDFVVLNKEYFSLTTNSFLLHGFYNYGHLILSKEKRSEAEYFYIGVPGNFYYKEKQVAILFGFESFEGKHEQAENGDFGYYMVSVEI